MRHGHRNINRSRSARSAQAEVDSGGFIMNCLLGEVLVDCVGIFGRESLGEELFAGFNGAFEGCCGGNSGMFR